MEPSHHSAITLSLRDLAQLFNPMDPSPIEDRDLDVDAEEFIVSSARELPPREDPALVLLLESAASSIELKEVEGAVHRYFSKRATLKKLEYRELMRRGRISLGVGLVFLVICLLLGELVVKSHFGAASDILREGLTIVGWVAMWRPLEICLYDWWPLREDQRRFDKLARIQVIIRIPELLPFQFDKRSQLKRRGLDSPAAEFIPPHQLSA